MQKKEQTKPCEWCGVVITKTAAQQSQRKYWTCGRSCANKVRIHRGNTVGWNENPYRGQRETRNCATCGKPVERYLNPKNVDKQWSCSYSCGASAKVKIRIAEGKWKRPDNTRKGDTIPCETCGVDVYRNKGEQKINKRFCSRECVSKAKAKNQIVKACVVCGAEMKVRPSNAERQYCSNRCNGIGVTKRPLERTHNGKAARKDKSGYVMIWEPENPNKVFNGWQYEHRVVVEKSIERFLQSHEAVHHINGIKDDNRIENLEVMDAKAHAALSARDYRDGVDAKLKRLEEAEKRIEEYERRFGSLEGE